MNGLPLIDNPNLRDPVMCREAVVNFVHGCNVLGGIMVSREQTLANYTGVPLPRELSKIAEDKS